MLNVRIFSFLFLGLALVACDSGSDSGSGSSGGSSSGDSGGTESSPPETGTTTTATCSSDGTYTNASFECLPAGSLLANSGSGVAENTVWRSGMRFPLQSGPAYLNSQVYRYGGYKLDETALGPDGNPFGSPDSGTPQCDSRNYSYPWQDNFCESRSSGDPTTNYCPTGKGHQGLDIRGAVCATNDANNTVVAVEDGEIITIMDHYTKMVSDDELFFFSFMHMHRDTRTYDSSDLASAAGGKIPVSRGDVLGRIGNFQGYDSGGSAVYTTRHLHFEMRTAVMVDGVLTANQPYPAYMSMVDAYERLLDGTP